MKKYILILTLALLLVGCGRQESDIQEIVDEEENIEIEDLESTDDTENDTAIEIEDDTVPEDISVASFSVVSEISGEIGGKYVLYGTDNSGNWCCGLLDENGNVQINPEYIGLYPLEGGNFLVTNDVNVWEDPIDMSLASECKIIDQNENILWEKEQNQNIYVVSAD